MYAYACILKTKVLRRLCVSSTKVKSFQTRGDDKDKL